MTKLRSTLFCVDEFVIHRRSKFPEESRALSQIRIRLPWQLSAQKEHLSTHIFEVTHILVDIKMLICLRLLCITAIRLFLFFYSCCPCPPLLFLSLPLTHLFIFDRYSCLINPLVFACYAWAALPSLRRLVPSQPLVLGAWCLRTLSTEESDYCSDGGEFKFRLCAGGLWVFYDVLNTSN